MTPPGANGYRPLNEVLTAAMPARDVEVTVFYTPIPVPGDISGAADETLVIEDYDTALGLGNVSLNAGDSLE